jgi:hypothetical protein
MCVDCVLASLRIAQVDLGDGPPPEVVLSQQRRDMRREVVAGALPGRRYQGAAVAITGGR